jgi:hypothetical protein
MFHNKHRYRVEIFWRFDIKNKQWLDILIGMLYTPDMSTHSLEGAYKPGEPGPMGE